MFLPLLLFLYNSRQIIIVFTFGNQLDFISAYSCLLFQGICIDIEPVCRLCFPVFGNGSAHWILLTIDFVHLNHDSAIQNMF